MNFVKIYKAANLSEAHFIKGLLQSEGVEVATLGKGLTVAIGELPLDVAQVDMYVKLNNKEIAKSIIKKYEENVKVDHLKSWKCDKCDIVNPSTFEICWKCNS